MKNTTGISNTTLLNYLCCTEAFRHLFLLPGCPIYCIL